MQHKCGHVQTPPRCGSQGTRGVQTLAYLPHAPRASQQMLETVLDFRVRTEFLHGGVDVVLSVGEARRPLVVEKPPHQRAAHGLSEQVLVAPLVLPPHHCERDDVDPKKTKKQVGDGFLSGETTLNPHHPRNVSGVKWWNGVLWTQRYQRRTQKYVHHVRTVVLCVENSMHANQNTALVVGVGGGDRQDVAVERSF